MRGKSVKPNKSDVVTNTNNFESLTEKELLATFGAELIHGKEAIVRNIKKCRELYNTYAAKSHDSKLWILSRFLLILSSNNMHESFKAAYFFNLKRKLTS